MHGVFAAVEAANAEARRARDRMVEEYEFSEEEDEGQEEEEGTEEHEEEEEEGKDDEEEKKVNDKEEIFSKRVKAGKRTYFFDVKATRSKDYYLTITESKRKFQDEGFTYEKHKIFLYKEDFKKFVDALNESVDHVKDELLPDVDFDQYNKSEAEKDKGSDEMTWE